MCLCCLCVSANDNKHSDAKEPTCEEYLIFYGGFAAIVMTLTFIISSPACILIWIISLFGAEDVRNLQFIELLLDLFLLFTLLTRKK